MLLIRSPFRRADSASPKFPRPEVQNPSADAHVSARELARRPPYRQQAAGSGAHAGNGHWQEQNRLPAASGAAWHSGASRLRAATGAPAHPALSPEKALITGQGSGECSAAPFGLCILRALRRSARGARACSCRRANSLRSGPAPGYPVSRGSSRRAACRSRADGTCAI